MPARADWWHLITHKAAQAVDPATRMATLPQLRHWIVWPVAGALIVLFLGFAQKLSTGIVQFELGIDQWLDANQNPALTSVALVINTALSPMGIVVILALSFLFLLFVRRSPVNAFAFTSIAAVGWLSSEVFKLIVHMPRPDGRLLSHPAFAETGGQSGFPSGHTTFAAAVLIAGYLLARHTRAQRWVAIVGPILVVIVAWSRLYGGAHYLLDVVGAVLVAFTATALYIGLWNRFGIRVLGWLPILRRIGPIPVSGSGRATMGAPHRTN